MRSIETIGMSLKEFQGKLRNPTTKINVLPLRGIPPNYGKW